MKYIASRGAIIALMALMAFIIGSIIGSVQAKASDRTELLGMAHNQRVRVNSKVLDAILMASHAYHVSAKEMFAIALIESGLNIYAHRTNNNGTIDTGIFQINSINFNKCKEYNVYTLIGNSMCCAKLLSILKENRPNDYIGVFHSKTPRFKQEYIAKISEVLYNSN